MRDPRIIERNIDGFLKVEAASFPAGTRWDRNDFLACAKRGSNCAYTAEFPARGLIAFGVFRVRRRSAEIINIAVLPDFRRQRVGYNIVTHAREMLYVRRFIVTVRERNLGAQLFYRSLGFKAVACKRGHFGDEDGIEFVWIRPRGEDI